METIYRMSLHKIVEVGSAATCKFYVGDVIKVLEAHTDNCFQLVVSSPPYNIRKKYERDNKRSFAEYVAWQTRVAELLVDRLLPSGSLCWQTGNYVTEGEIIPLDGIFIEIFRRLGLKLRNRIIWRFNFGLNADRRFSGRYETMLWFTKTDDYVFNLDPVRVPQLYPGKRHAVSKGSAKAGLPSGNPLGKNPSDFWEFYPNSAFLKDTIWELPNVKANHPEKTQHPCQFPIELVERCILAFTKPQDLIIDPFVGTGASCVAAIKHARCCVGIDKEPTYIALAEQRVRLLRKGELSMRTFGKAISRRSETDKVSRVPEQWSSIRRCTDGQEE